MLVLQNAVKNPYQTVSNVFLWILVFVSIDLRNGVVLYLVSHFKYVILIIIDADIKHLNYCILQL